MERPVYDGNASNTILNQVHEDMPVCDNAGNEIGRVRQVFLGAVSDKANARGVGPAAPSSLEWRGDSLVDQVAKSLAGDGSMPEVLRERLLRQGFIRIDTKGLLASDRFALADQIESVTEDCVRLSVPKDELIEQ